MNRYKELAKNTGIMAISQFSSKILTFLLVPLYTSVLTTSEYGIYDLSQSTIQLLIPFFTLNIVDAVMRFLMDKDAKKDSIITVGIKYIFLGSCLATTTMIILRFFSLIPMIIGLEYYILIFFIISLINQFAIQTAKGLDYIKDMGIAGVIGTAITLISNIIFLIVFKMGLKGFFIASILGQAIPGFYLCFRMHILKYFNFSNNDIVKKEMLIYCIPLLTNTIAWVLNSVFDKYVVAIMIGESANGLLGVAYKIPTILVTFQSIFNQSWQISAVKEYGQEISMKFYSDILAMMNTVMTIMCSFMILFVKVLAGILFSNNFFSAWEYVPLLLVSCVINAVSGIIGAILGAKKDSKTMAIAGIVGMIVNIILNIALVKLFGIQGAIIATVISSFIIFYVRKVAVVDIFNQKVIRNVMVTWLLLTLQSIISISFQTFGGYLFQVTILFIILFYNHNMIINSFIYIRNRFLKG